nr:hypothetical protein [Tanacetum cinerariifolium]
MIWQPTGKCTEPGKMQHSIDGKAWKNFDTKYPDFTKEPRNVRLVLDADGFNPFGNISKDIDVYLRPLIEDLKVLWDRKALLNDLSYIPLNNEHNEPTQGDIGKTSNEPTQATRNEFEELYASANEKLYPDCDYVSRLDFMAKFTYFKVKGYKLPPSYYAIKKTFKTIGLRYESIHACEHDCCLFRGDDNKDFDLCPVCKTSRWKDSNTSGKKVPKNVLRYFLIIPRLQRLYKSSHTAKEMIWHATGKCTEPGKMQHSIDGRAWKNFDTNQAYSMWPMIFMTYNLPVWLCMKESSFMLTLLIPASKSPSKDIDVYLRPLIEGLKTINDFPARSSLSGWSRQGYKACPTCNKETPSVRVLSKTAYVGHRRFLKKPHKWKSSREFNGQTDNRDPPKEFGQDEILEALEGGPIRPRWMYPFERYMKKLKGYVQNKAKPKGSIAEGSVAEEALTFSSHNFRDVTTKINRPDHNVDPPLPTPNPTGGSHKKFSGGFVIVVEDDPDIIHFYNTSDLPLSTSLNDLDNATLHIDGQSTKVDVPPDIIIDVVDEEDHITDDEDALPHDLIKFDNEDLINVDDDGVDKMSADVAWSHGGDGGGDDRPLHTMYPAVAWVALLIEAKANKSPIWVAV